MDFGPPDIAELGFTGRHHTNISTNSRGNGNSKRTEILEILEDAAGWEEIISADLSHRQRDQ